MHLPNEQMARYLKNRRMIPVGSALFDLKIHAESKARGLGVRIGLAVFSSMAVLISILVWLESFRYFRPELKSIMIASLGIILLTIFLVILIVYWLLKSQRLSITHPEQLARAIGEMLPAVGDRILNAVQLSRTQPDIGISSSLYEAAIQDGISEMNKIPEHLLFPTNRVRKYLKRTLLGVVALLILYVVNFQKSNAAIMRLSQPDIQFDYPLPLSLSIRTDLDQVLAGDTLLIEGQIKGRSVDQVTIDIQTRKDTVSYLLPVTDKTFRFPMEHVLASFSAVVHVANQRPWEPWKTIESSVLKVQVINRPLVQDLIVKIKPPAYTRLPSEVYTRNIMDISGLKGSRIVISGLASKEIGSARLHFESAKVLDAELKGQHFNTGFTLQSSDHVWFELLDEEGVSNLDPLVYPVYVTVDSAPLVRVMIPGQDVIIGENLLIPIRLKLDDDFGFSRLELNYQVQHPEYLMADTILYTKSVDFPHTHQASLEFNFRWDLSSINLMPEDAIQYWFVVWDNNTVDGPSKALSKRWMARLPSMDEMFEAFAQGNETIKQEQEDVLDVVKEIREKVDELALEVQKDPNLSWEQQQSADEAIKQVEQLKEQLENISQQLDEMMTTAEEQNLLSDETLDKYSELQQLMDQLITDELREAMERLQDAMDQDDPREMESAMEDFQSAMEDFQKSVERTLEIFKQVEIEQKIDELTTRLNDLADRQEALSSDLDNRNASDAAKQEEQINTDFEKAQELAENLEDLLKQNGDLSPESIQKLQEQMEQEQINENLDQAASMMEQGQMSQAQPPAEQAAQSLRQMASQSDEMQMNMQQQMMSEVMSEFRSALLKALRLSQAQEALETPTAHTSRQSSLLRDHADAEMSLMQGLRQLSGEMQALGNKTFAVSPAMGKSMGSVQANMQEAIDQLEARNPRKSAQSQAAARESLNRLARQLANSMESLQQSGEASGFSNYMQQLQQMAGQQQGLNSQTMMQMGMGSPSMMQQLARQQLQLRETLSQIENGMGSDSRMLGDLGKIGKEMEAVAKELQSRRPSQKIHEQQERILSRLLDAQRSASQKDFSKKRKSETGSNKTQWLGSGHLPEDLGEARDQLYEELIFSLKQSYSREEQALIREYFNCLEAELNE